MEYLTFDIGQQSTKIAIISNKYKTLDSNLEKPEPKELSDLIISEAKKRNYSGPIAISSTYFVQHNGKESGIYERDVWKPYFNVESIKSKTGSKLVRQFNDGIATAMAINISCLKTETIKKEEDKTNSGRISVIYLGTGLNIAHAQKNEKGIYVPIYSPTFVSRLPGGVVDDNLVNAVTTAAGLNSPSKLRWTNVLASRGLETLYKAIKGKNVEGGARSIIEGGKEEFSDVFHEYSKIVGRSLQQIAAQVGSWDGIYLGGNFSTAVAPHLDNEALVKEFYPGNNPVVSIPFSKIPIYSITDNRATNKGALFGLLNNLPTTVNVF